MGGGCEDDRAKEDDAAEISRRGLLGVILASLLWAISFGTGDDESDDDDSTRDASASLAAAVSK